MILAAHVVPAASVSYASLAPETQGGALTTATAKKEPAKGRFSTFQFDQKIFAWEGGRFKLRLKENPILILNPANLTVEMKDWGLELNMGSAPELPRYIVRRFLFLWSQAQNNALSETDAQSWEKILGLVDMQDFAVQQSEPRYIEGQLLAIRDVLRVQWHDGTFCYIPREFTSRFDLLNEGEFFSAFVKFGRNDEPIAIDRVLPVAAPAVA